MVKYKDKPDSEGHVVKYSITLSSNSKIGVKGVSSLLSKLNINSKIGCYKKGHYSLTITHKDNLTKFKKLVGFSIKRKAERLK